MIVVRAKCIHSDYNPKLIGITGYIEEGKSKENIMFYPDNEYPVYRVCLRQTDIEILED